MAQVCPSCGQENPQGFQLCGMCGTPLAAERASRREERKVVTVLFADLVGFTSRSERLDPEEVRALQAPYWARVRAELERHGGTVEKFIGDAVMALFGAPRAHEDDPERAVRAAFAIRDAVAEDGDLQMRIGVTTGEALVVLGARPSEGEGMASGDVVNTAARLQAAAPVNGVLVDEPTYRATARSIEYREAEAVRAKGKTEPVSVWEAVEARSRFGLDTVQAGAALVGRQRELDRLTGALASARAERTAQLVTLVGVPGIGKSRLVYELSRIVDADPDLITWRQGRSLPYGDGVTFWALGEMVKAEAGILESDATAEAERKLCTVVEDAVAADAAWVEPRLRPLVGLAAGGEAAADRAESFAAWRRFLEGLAERRPTVLVFEDLHWADEDLLDFVDELVDWASDVPLLCLCTARPELLDRRPGWGGGKANTATISLAPLSDEDTARLIGALTERAVMPWEEQEAILTRAGGNPLYAEQFARMLAERRTGGDLALPETVQGIIAARLDLLPAHEKALLHDASVLGKVFWLGALVQLSRPARTELDEPLRALERKEFVRRERRPSIAAEQEYTFRHLLVRDVAYGQIPRAERADKHRAAAAWLASLSPERSEDRADLLAHHYGAALDYALAVGQPAGPLRDLARDALREAGDRAYSLHSYAAAARYYERALELSAKDDAHRPAVLVRFGFALLELERGGAGLVDEGAGLWVAAGEADKAAEALADLGFDFWFRGHKDEARRRFERAVALVEGRPDSPAKARVLSLWSRGAYLAGDDSAVTLAREALTVAQRFGLDDIASQALNTIGMARTADGDAGGIADLEQSVELALATGQPVDIYSALNNLANMLSLIGDLESAGRVHERLRERDARFAIPSQHRWVVGEDILNADLAGRWDEALRLADRFIAECAESPHYLESPARFVRSRIRLGQGDRVGALEDSRIALELARQIGDPQALYPALLARAGVLYETSSRAEAEARLDEIAETRQTSQLRGAALVQLAPLLAALGRARDYLDLVAGLPPTPWLDAGRAMAAGEWERGIAILDRVGARADAAAARRRAAEILLTAGRRREAREQVRAALAFYESVGATAYVREGNALLAESA